MPKFSQASLSKLDTCHPDLIYIFEEVIKVFDCTIIEGHRNKDLQEADFNAGKTKLHYPNGKHNSTPSMAIDAAPYPVDWNDTSRFYYFAGVVMGIGIMLKNEGLIAHHIRWGGDWNKNNEIKDETFRDLPHFELTI